MNPNVDRKDLPRNCLFKGIAYTGLTDVDVNKRQPKHLLEELSSLLESSNNDPLSSQKYYEHPLVRLSKSDISNGASFVGKPVCNTHDNKNVGIIIDQYIDGDNLMVEGYIQTRRTYRTCERWNSDRSFCRLRKVVEQ